MSRNRLTREQKQARDDFPFPRFIDPPSYTNKLEPPSPPYIYIYQNLQGNPPRLDVHLFLFLFPFFFIFPSFLSFFSRFTLQRCSRESRSFHAQVVYINVPVANKTRTRGSKITLSSTERNDLYWSPRRSSEQISRNGGRRLFGRTSRASTLSYFPPIFPRTMTNRIEKQSH